MASKSNMEEKLTGATRVSVRHPRQIFWFRMALLLLVLVTLDIDFNHFTSKSSSIQKDWGSSFIAENLLLERSVVSQLNSPSKSYSAISSHQKIMDVNDGQITKNQTKRVIRPLVSEFDLNKKSLEKTMFLNSKSSHGLLLSETSESLKILPLSKMQVAKMDLVSSGFSLDPNTFSHALLDVPNQAHKWYVYLNVGPQLTQGIIAQPSSVSYQLVSGNSNLEAKTGGTSTTKNGQSFALNFGLGYQLSKKWDVISGFKYAQWNGSQVAYYDSEVFQNQNILTSEASDNEDGTKSFSNKEQEVNYSNYFTDTLVTDYRLSLIEVPLLIRYNFCKNKWNYFVNTGFSGVFQSSYKASYKSNVVGSGNFTESRNNLAAVNFIFGAGVEYSLGNDLHLQFTPQFSHGRTVFDNALTNTKLSTFGLFGGLKYIFK